MQQNKIVLSTVFTAITKKGNMGSSSKHVGITESNTVRRNRARLFARIRQCDVLPQFKLLAQLYVWDGETEPQL